MVATEDNGYVYALENKAFPGYIKVGQTKNLSRRLAQFNDTGIPDGKPTLLLFAVKLTGYKKAERLLHSALSEKRESSSKEFFKATFNQVKTAFKLLAFNDPEAEWIRPETYNSAITGKTYTAVKRKVGSRPNRTFKYLSIPIGATLTFKETPKFKLLSSMLKTTFSVVADKNTPFHAQQSAVTTTTTNYQKINAVMIETDLIGLSLTISWCLKSSRWSTKNRIKLI